MWWFLFLFGEGEGGGRGGGCGFCADCSLAFERSEVGDGVVGSLLSRA